ncbi:MAG: hypothetical protein INQ03_12670 [Candidatus Heimdallarchaeota archaeon]|nr:hypothetical protein [Candidatus Heimdallarchaeota archaeon]
MPKIDQIDEMFKKSTKPTLKVEDIDKITSIGCIYDSTPQGVNSLKLASEMAKTLHLPLHSYSMDDYYLTLKIATDEIKNKEEDMLTYLKNFATENEMEIETEILIGGKIQKVLSLMDAEFEENEKLSTLIKEKLIEHNFSLLVAGTPLMRNSEDTGTLGYYLSILLEESKIHTNFLLVPNVLAERGDTMLGMITFNQMSGTLAAIIRRGLSIRGKEKEIKVIGLVEKSTLETIAKSEMIEGDEEDLELKIEEVRDRIHAKFAEEMSSVEISDDLMSGIEMGIESGNLTSMVKLILEQTKPSLVMVRSVSKLDDHFSKETETLTRIVLSEGYPVLVLFD